MSRNNHENRSHEGGNAATEPAPIATLSLPDERMGACPAQAEARRSSANSSAKQSHESYALDNAISRRRDLRMFDFESQRMWHPGADWPGLFKQESGARTRHHGGDGEVARQARFHQTRCQHACARGRARPEPGAVRARVRPATECDFRTRNGRLSSVVEVLHPVLNIDRTVHALHEMIAMKEPVLACVMRTRGS